MNKKNKQYFNSNLQNDIKRILTAFKENPQNFSDPSLKARKTEYVSLDLEYIIDVNDDSYYYHNESDRDADFYFLNKELYKIKRNGRI